MGERMIVRQNSAFEVSILAPVSHEPDGEFGPAVDVRSLSPYGMLLAGLGACTSIVLHTYAQHHGVPLDEVEIHVEYGRVFADDCEGCERIDEYEEAISMRVALWGDLEPDARQRLVVVARHCPIHKMLARGIEVTVDLLAGPEGESP